MNRRRGMVVTLCVIVVLAVCWWLFGAMGYFIEVERVGGWIEATEPIDLATEAGATALLETFPADQEVDNLILLLADGMGFSHVTAARALLTGLNRPLTFERFPVVSWAGTHTSEELKTDSAATATSLATGIKTYQGGLGVDAHGAPAENLFEAARERGLATGFVTDSYFFDASVAAFTVHHDDRDDYPQIAARIPMSGSDVIIGEMRDDYPSDVAEEERLYRGFREAGYSVATTASELWGLGWNAEQKIAALFPPGVVADDDVEPTLEQLFDLALDRLSASPGGFVLLAETEDPDSGSHDDDFRQVLRGMAKLEAMTKKAVSFARSDGRTLVLVTSDHETGGLALISGDSDRPLGVRWATTSHTGEPVPLFAFGPGAEELGSVRDNTDVAPVVARLLGLELGNRSESAAAAR